MTQTLIPEGSGQLVGLPGLDFYSFPLTLITGHGDIKTWNQPKCLLTDEWINIIWSHLHVESKNQTHTNEKNEWLPGWRVWVWEMHESDQKIQTSNYYMNKVWWYNV